MTHPPPQITFDATPVQIDEEWRIVAKHPNGEEQYIAGFIDEAEALAWLGGENRKKWLAARGYSEIGGSSESVSGTTATTTVNYTEGDMHGTTEVDPTTQQCPLTTV